MPMQRKTALFTKETKADTFYFVYCLLHVPITVLIDSSLAIPREYQPQMQQMIIKFHVSTNKDFLLQSPPVWLVVFGWIELVFQLPFFFIAAYALYKRSTTTNPYLFAYGLEAAFTTLCCLVSIMLQGPLHGLTSGEICNLIGVYLPTFLIPSYLAFDMFTRECRRSRYSGAHKSDEKKAN